MAAGHSPGGVPALAEAPGFGDARPDHAPDPAKAAGRRDLARLEGALAALPPEFRECLVLWDLEQLSYKDIGLITRLPVGAVISRLWRARHALLPIAARLVSGGAARRDGNTSSIARAE